MLNQVLNVKIKYENIIKRLLENEECGELTRLAIQDASIGNSESIGAIARTRPSSSLQKYTNEFNT